MDVRNKWLAMREIRKKRKISSLTVAMSCGMSGDRYLRIEKNEVNNVTDTERSMLTAFFGLPEEELFATNCEPCYGYSRCKKYKLPPEEVEKMLVEQFGKKLKPNKKRPAGSQALTGREEMSVKG